MTQTGAPLTLFNSLTRATEAFAPIDPRMVRLYSCGPTVYSTAHLGNLRAYVFTDTLRRVLNWKGYATTHVINITDVGHLTSDADAGDDKMELAAQKAKVMALNGAGVIKEGQLGPPRQAAQPQQMVNR